MKEVLGLLGLVQVVSGWSPGATLHPSRIFPDSRRLSSTTNLQACYEPIFSLDTAEDVEKFDRIDDVIMGGISSSTLVPFDGYAKWFGTCRTDGGGFCGIRTLPFVEPLSLDSTEGFYMKAKLVSDNEPERRVWKFSCRTKPDRGEQLYQAPFEMSTGSVDCWPTVRIPFDSFRLVRGPRTVPDGPPMNVSETGVYQVGMTMSKFGMGAGDIKELENFRPGFFEVQVKEIGVYSAQSVKLDSSVQVVSKKEALQRRPQIVKALLPIARAFFSEESRRRKSALRILMTKRGMSRSRAIWFGIQSRSRTNGKFRAMMRTARMMSGDVLRLAFFTVLRFSLVYPIVIVSRTIRFLSKLRKNEEAREEVAA